MKKILLGLSLVAFGSFANAGDIEKECAVLKEFAHSISKARQSGDSIRQVKQAMPKPKNETEKAFNEMSMSIIDLVYKYPIAKDQETKDFTTSIASAQVYLICLDN